MGLPAKNLVYQPWFEEVARLQCEGFGASEIGRRLSKDTLLICDVMDHPDYKASLSMRQHKIDLLFVERLLNLWDLSDTMIKVARETAEAYLAKLSEDTPEKEIRSLRKDALDTVKDILDRIGLRAPDKSEVKVTETKQTVDATPLDVYEKRLQLVREYKEAGVEMPEGLCKVELDG